MTSYLYIGLLHLGVTLVMLVVHLVDGLPTCTDDDGKPQFFDGTQCKTCPSCSSGYGLSEICGKGQGLTAVCRVCSDGRFSDDDSMEMCRSCRICSNTMEDAVPCTATTDRKCGQCKCGYFRYKERDDHCAKCAEENSRDLYEECSLLCPSPTPSFQEPPVIDVTTEEPITTSTTSLDPLVIVGIVVLLIFLLVIAVVALVLCLPQKSVRRCFDFCGHRYKPVPNKKNDCNSCPNEEAKLTPICDPEVTIEINPPEDEVNDSNGTSTEEESDNTDTPPGDKPCEVTITENPPIRCHGEVEIDPSKVDVARQGATPFVDQEGELLPTQESQEGLATASGSIDSSEGHGNSEGDSNSHVDSHSQGSRQEGELLPTQESQEGLATASGSIDSSEGHGNSEGDSNSHVDSHSQGSRHSDPQIAEFQDAEFDSKLKQALVAAKATYVDSMHWKVMAFLNSMLDEKPEHMKTSDKFHYGKLAELFRFSDDEIRQMKNAEDVLIWVAATREKPFTVADLLDRLAQSGKCYDVVRKLVNQIVPDFEFDGNLEQARFATEDIELASMHRDDIDLLNHKLHERPEIVDNSKRFHYGKMAELFGFRGDEIRHMTTAEDVFDKVAATRKAQFTVADLLDKLAQSGKCYDVVRELVDQILKRQLE
ncbi:uncharacterized protein LOC117306340 isoform X2 [Asterias rubens]|uniref:uncharacterized protein LOC117306340 isoform X2 n=1 Tax=Asterias rubens TaxID=7604 RepID=UPI0014558D1D|nr:uncharacterized protein LOC117306340 isoform X2 [Asterias rubens]